MLTHILGEVLQESASFKNEIKSTIFLKEVYFDFKSYQLIKRGN